MGIQNKDGALYFATGVDNTGLYSGRREAIGIIKAMAGEITSFDVFGGLGISAAMVFAKASKDAYDFEKQFQKSMYEVATISSTISSSLTDYMNQVLEVTQRVPVAANDAAKALYQIVSAGHDGADAMEILEVSAKAAIGGVTDTATSADAITTILNAYKMSAAEAEKVSDMLFTTARLGKTTMGELGQSIAQAAPIAASYGVEIDQVLAAVASLTKQGTPTAQAMTQIRAAIIGTSKVLGDGAFNTRTFQEALEEVANRSKGSESKLRELVPEIEAVNGVLGMTGKNAKNAASDLEELGNSTGASEAAFKKMNETADAQLQLLQNNITAALRPLGEAILKEVSEIAKSFNEAFENGDLERILETLEALLITGAAAWGTYKVATLLAAQAELYHQGIAHGWTLSMQLQANWLNIVSKAKEILTAKTKALTAVMMKNPYAITAAAVVALGVGIYKLITYQTDAQKAQEKLNKSYAEFNAEAMKETYAVDNVFAALKRANPGTEERKKLIKQINTEYKQYLPALLSEKSNLDEIDRANKAINDSLRSQIALKIKNQASTEMVTKEVNTQADALESIRQEVLKKTGSNIIADNAIKTIEEHTQDFQKAGTSWEKAFEQAIHSVRALYGKDKKGNKIEFEISSNTEDYIKSYYDMKYQQYQIDKKFDPLINKMTTVTPDVTEPTITPTLTPGKPDKKNYKGEIANAQKEQEKLIVKMALDMHQARINAKEDGEEKYLEQMAFDYKKELLIIKDKGEELIKAQQEIERKQWEEANKNKKDDEKGFFKPQTTKVEQLPQEQQLLLTEMSADAMDNNAKAILIHQKELHNNLLSQLSDYKSQEEALNIEWGKKITDAIATGDQELIERTKVGKEKALSQLNAQMLMESVEWLRLFGNLDTLTVDELNNLIDSIQKQLDSGTLKLNPVDAKALMDSLSKAKDKVAEKSPFQTLAKSSGEMKSALAELKKAEESGLTGEALDVYKNKVKQTAEGVKKSISAIKNAYGQVSDVMRSAADLISMVDEGLGETVNNAISLGDAVMNVGDVVAQAVIGFAAGMSAMETASVILLVIKAVIMAVMAVMNLFNNDKKHEKKIQNLQKEIDNLQRAYDRLGKSIENAFSSDKAALIDQQSENLRQQNQKMLQQISEEEDKKKTDHDKIDDWRNKIEDNNAQIEENSKKNRIEAIMGTDIMDAIDQFAQAYADAWASGEKAAGKSANVVKSLIKTAIIDMLKKNLQPEVTAFMTFLSGAMADGIIDSVEQKKIDEWEQKLENIADDTLAGKEKWLEDEEKNKKSGVTGKLEAALTEGTASELVGLWNITAMDIRSLKELSAEHFLEWKHMKLDVNAILQETIKIQQNTLRTADNTDGITSTLSALQKELAEIRKNTKNNNSRG